MISVIIYGRNDSHGYNLPRRAALSLNCIAEVLTDPQDEILFVDYNTPNSYPSFIESIDDTLTEKTKTLLKIISIPPEVHFQYKDSTHLVVSEPLARNIALRRSNPNNRWILSTNTDMILLPRKEHISLSDIARNLVDGSYCTPRFELPESLWECLDRKESKKNIQIVNEWAKDLNLNFVVYRDPWVVFDAPGDFQLMLRDQLFEINGFDESMLLGWHVDSNIFKRLFLLNGETKSLIEDIYGYHCMHTRTATNMHKHNAKANDLDQYVFSVNTPYLAHQAKTWGLPEMEFEIISALEPRVQKNLCAVKKVVVPSASEYYEFTTNNCYSNLNYPSEHVLVYLSSIFATYPKNTAVTYVGINKVISKFLEKLLFELGMTFYSLNEAQITRQKDYLANQFYDESTILIFDFGVDSNQTDFPMRNFPAIASIFTNTVIRNKRDSDENVTALKYFIAINSKENFFQHLTKLLINCNDAPLSSFYLAGFPLEGVNEVKSLELIKKALRVLEDHFPVSYAPSFYKYKKYEYNCILHFTDFSNNIKGCQDLNWSNHSPKGTWTIGEKASIFLKLKEVPKADVKVKILLKPFTRLYHQNQELELLVNNSSVKKWQFKHRFFYLRRMVPKKSVTAIIPASMITNNEVTFSFKIKHPSEGNQFGVRIYSMVLSA